MQSLRMRTPALARQAPVFRASKMIYQTANPEQGRVNRHPDYILLADPALSCTLQRTLSGTHQQPNPILSRTLEVTPYFSSSSRIKAPVWETLPAPSVTITSPSRASRTRA
jgi:hypothetical protein